MNTKISYLYRDGSNYKQRNKAIVKDVMTEEQKQTILDSLNCGEFFIPSQVGLPEERLGTITVDDHCWFELDEDSFSETEELETVDISADELVKRFAAAKNKWDESLFELVIEDNEDEE